MNDLSKTIIAKSDQLNSDDLIGGPITIRITRVSVVTGEQPIAVNYEGDNNKPWKPCKTMRRLLVHAWGTDGNAYAGRRLTLFRDGAVRFGGDAVGGIRVSHMSDIGDKPLSVGLTVTKGRKSPYTVQPLVDRAEPLPKPTTVKASSAAGPPQKPANPNANYVELEQFLDSCVSVADIEDWKTRANELRKETPGIEYLRVQMNAKLEAMEAKQKQPADSLYGDGNLPD